MKVLILLIRTKLKIVRALVFEKTRSAVIRNAAMTAVLAAMLYASYLFFHDLIFRYVVNLEDIGFLLIERLVSTGFLFFFFMLIFSSFVTALATLFRSSETEYLFSTPITDLQLFTGKFIDILVYSSWAILVMALPILYSYAKIREFGTREYALTGFVVLLPFIVIAVSLGTILAFLSMYASKRMSMRKLLFLSGLVFLSLVYSMVRFSRPTELVIPFTEDFRALNLFINNFRMNSHPLTPNFWLIQSLRSLVYGDYRDFALYSSALMSTALFSVTLLYATADRIFFRTWVDTTERRMIRRFREAEKSRYNPGFFSRPAKSQFRALLNKDFLMFVRDPGQWSQLFLILALLSIYFVVLGFMPEEIEMEQWRTIIFLMNFGFCSFVLATLAIRFVYPSISLEGDSFWVLGSAPLSVTTLFKEKLLSSFVVFIVITEFIALVSGLMLELETLYLVLTIGGIALMSLSLLSLSVGFGAAYPDFSERNPSRIASSPGGILTIVVSLFYLALMMFLLAVPSYRYTVYLVSGGDFPMKELLVSVAAVLVLNVVTIVFPLRFGAKSLAGREF